VSPMEKRDVLSPPRQDLSRVFLRRRPARWVSGRQKLRKRVAVERAGDEADETVVGRVEDGDGSNGGGGEDRLVRGGVIEVADGHPGRVAHDDHFSTITD
jgi:hypothetical protein